MSPSITQYAYFKERSDRTVESYFVSGAARSRERSRWIDFASQCTAMARQPVLPGAVRKSARRPYGSPPFPPSRLHDRHPRRPDAGHWCTRHVNRRRIRTPIGTARAGFRAVLRAHDLALHHSQWDPQSSAPSRSGQRRDAVSPPRLLSDSGTIRKSRRRPLATAGSGRPRAAAPCSVLCLCGRNLPGIVTLTGSNARFRNPASDRHMRSQCLTGATVAAPKPEIGENCPNVTSPPLQLIGTVEDGKSR